MTTQTTTNASPATTGQLTLNEEREARNLALPICRNRTMPGTARGFTTTTARGQLSVVYSKGADCTAKMTIGEMTDTVRIYKNGVWNKGEVYASVAFLMENNKA